MRIYHAIRNCFFIRGFFINSLPKAGTNLLAKAVELFPGIRRENDVHNRLADNMGQSENNADTFLYGIDWPRNVPLSKTEDTFMRLKHGTFCAVHLPYSNSMAQWLETKELKSLLILRDPRDVVVSHARYVADRPDHFLFAFYQNLTKSERIMRSIEGVNLEASNGPMLLNIYDRYCKLIHWMKSPLNYTTFFEKLVGPAGGGSREAQREELIKIAEHLGLSFNDKCIDDISNQLFGGTETFHKGRIGSWREHFSEEHKRLFNEIAGSLIKGFGFE